MGKVSIFLELGLCMCCT